MNTGDISAIRTKVARGYSLHEAVDAETSGVVFAADIVGISRAAHRSVEGVGDALQPLVDDPTVTDILVNGPGQVWVDRGRGLERHRVRSKEIATESDVRALAVRLAAMCGQRLDDAAPIVDATFPGGMRLHAVLPPLAAEGTLISVRTQRARAWTLHDLHRAGTITAACLPVVNYLVEKRANVMISGATGSGKTTLLSAALGAVPGDERIVVIEESAELHPQHPHVVHLQTRRANVQGAGEVTMSDLVRAAMRMRPDRLVLGECRGAEVREVLSAMNTGHDGGWATIHANSSMDVPARLVALGALAGMSEGTVAAQAASAIDALIHIRRTDTGRLIEHIAVVERQGSELHAVMALDAAGRRGPGWERLERRIA